VGNKVINLYDILGNKIPTVGHFHGNYCGDNRVNGKDIPQTGIPPEKIGWPSPGEGPRPEDEADSCCMHHDKCFAQVAKEKLAPDETARRKKVCDTQLQVCWSKSLCADNVKVIDKLKIVMGIPVFIVAQPSCPNRNPEERKCCNGCIEFDLFRFEF
jgi:hypothetical protein